MLLMGDSTYYWFPKSLLLNDTILYNWTAQHTQIQDKSSKLLVMYKLDFLANIGHLLTYFNSLDQVFFF